MWRAGRDYSSHWELRLSLYEGLGVHVEGWAGLLSHWVSAVAICKAVCHEGLEETGEGRMMRGVFDIEF